MWSKFFKKKKNSPSGQRTSDIGDNSYYPSPDVNIHKREGAQSAREDSDYGGGTTPRGEHHKRTMSNPPAYKQAIDTAPGQYSAQLDPDMASHMERLNVNDAHPSIVDISPPKRPKQFSGPEISPEDITLISLLSGSDKGNQGIVYKALCKGMDVCVKEVKLPTDRSGEKAIANFTNEVKLFSEISHSNVCMFYGACLRPGNWRLVTELCVGDLSDLIKNKKKQVTLYEKLLIARDVCRGMAWLHHLGVLHLDLKPENLLLDDRGTVKVTDFGYSKIKADSKLGLESDENLSEGGSPLYMAPERLDRKPYTSAADVYSFGILFWQLLTRKEPFLKYQLIGDRETFNKAVIIDRERPEIPETYQQMPVLVQCLTTSWSHDPRDRPTFVQLVSMIDSLLVDSAVHDPVGREFWKTYFFKKPVDLKTKVAADTPLLMSKVPWKDFIHVFAQLIGLDKGIVNTQLPEVISDKPLPPNPTEDQIQSADEQHLREFSETSTESKLVAGREMRRRQTLLKVLCLQQFLADEDGMVSLERFGKIIDIFGPLSLNHPGQSNRSSLKNPILGEDLLGKMFDMMNRPWFHGDMSMNEAFALLKDKDVGMFLVRFSSTTNQFVISNVVKKDGGRFVVHIRVKHQPQIGFSIPDSNRPEPDLYALLQAHQDKFVTPQAPEATKYKYITTMTISRDGGYGEEDEVGILW
eukprot:TRINITY_DN1727_c0_g1_i1.p1 TRINITY_DN1727_c0_g1~~TRINITY_DN1727_c0_g1_i1.p1  ORF type:complete len:695 (-),score=171.92 TRINITY_DN1727_c0_g1_i1:120-2204(-)